MDLLRQKILILGGTGHLGSSLIHYLVQSKKVPPSNIRIFYLPNTPTKSLEDIMGLDLFPGNILDVADVKHAAEGVDLVFDLVGNTTFDPRKKRLQWLINVEGTRNVLETARSSATIERVCYTSTVNTLGVPNPKRSLGTEDTSPYTSSPRMHSFSSPEEALTFADAARTDEIPHWERQIGIGYFDSKLTGQELVNKYCRDYGLNIRSILPGTMFGPYDSLVGTGMYLITISKGQMPGVLKGGLPLAHVMDIAEGHVLAMEKAKPGSRYIMTGFEEDNRSLKDMAAIIADVLASKMPEKKIKAPSIEFKPGMAKFGAILSETYAALFKQPCVLSRDSVRAGGFYSYYTYKLAERELGYTPKRTFRQAIEEMYGYYTQHGLFNATGRFVDKVK